MLIFAFSPRFTYSAENITIQTENSGFFFNIISDATYLLDPDLKTVVAADFNSIVDKSKFNYQGYNWPPKIDAKTRISNIYRDIHKNNIKESMARLVQPVVEAACTPQHYDPFNDFPPKCIKNLLNYSIITTINIKYDYKSKKSIDMYTDDLKGLNDKNRYQQMVRTIADIMNNAYERFSKKIVVKNANIVKHPIQLVGASSVGSRKASKCVKPNAPHMPSYRNEMEEYEKCHDLEMINVAESSTAANNRNSTSSSCVEPNSPFSQSYKADMVEYEQCLNLKKIASGASPYDIIQERNAKRQAEEEARQRAAIEAQVIAEQQQQFQPVNTGAINTSTGEFLAPAGSGYVGTKDGTYYAPAGPNGIINTRTGQFSPVFK